MELKANLSLLLQNFRVVKIMLPARSIYVVAGENCTLAANKKLEEASIRKEICDLRSINHQIRERD